MGHSGINNYLIVSMLLLQWFGSLEATLEVINPPQNTTTLVNETVVFPCGLGEILTDQSLQSLEIPARRTNVNVIWYRRVQYLDFHPVNDIESLKTRIETPTDGKLIVKELRMDDSGFYECRIYNGIGERLSAAAYLNVEFPATVEYTPPVQYLPEGGSGRITCEVYSNPPLQLVEWRKDDELLEPCKTEGLGMLNQGRTLVIDRVNKSHQGNYTCTPYNIHGTHGPSPIQVIVVDSPKFLVTPEPVYEGRLGTSLEIPCTASPGSSIYWRKSNRYSLPQNRVRVTNETLLFGDLQEEDYGEYLCFADSGVDQLATSTKVIVEGIRPHPPYNFTATAIVTMSDAVTLRWEQAMAAGADARQSFLVRYKELGEKSEWKEIPALPPTGIKQFTVSDLSPGNTYEFQVAGINGLGEGEPSKIISATTRGPPKPYAPQNVTIVNPPDKFAISIHWEINVESMHVGDKITYFQVQHRLADSQSGGWENVGREDVRSSQTAYSYLVRHLEENVKYFYRVVTIPLRGSPAASGEVGYTLLPRDMLYSRTSDCDNKSA